MIKAPCGNCEKRGCGAYHSQCKPYLEFQEKCEEVRKQRVLNLNLSIYKQDCVKVRKGDLK